MPSGYCILAEKWLHWCKDEDIVRIFKKKTITKQVSQHKAMFSTRRQLPVVGTGGRINQLNYYTSTKYPKFFKFC